MAPKPSSDDVVEDQEYGDDFDKEDEGEVAVEKVEKKEEKAEAGKEEKEEEKKEEKEEEKKEESKEEAKEETKEEKEEENKEEKKEEKIEEKKEESTGEKATEPEKKEEAATSEEVADKPAEEGVKRSEAKAESGVTSTPAADGAKKITFGLFDGDDEIADIVISADATWEEFKKEANAHSKFAVGHFIYESQGEEVSCRSAKDWQECLEFVEKAKGELKGKLDVDIFAIVNYTLELMQAGHKIGDIVTKSTASWEDFQKSAKEQLQIEVKGIKYDDDYGERKQKGVGCANQEHWEDLLDMMEVDEKYLKNRLKIQILSFTLQCYKGDDVVKTITVFPDDDWAEIASQLRVVEGEPSAFEYEDEKEELIECGDDDAWQKCFALLRKQGSLEVDIIAEDDDPGDPPELPPIQAKKPAKSDEIKAADEPKAALKGAESGSKALGISPAVLHKLMRHKAAIVKACADRDAGGHGLVKTSDLAKELQKVGGCPKEIAEQLLATSKRDARGKNKDVIDYALFFRRFRYIDGQERGLITDVLKSGPLQAARLAVLNRPEVFTKILESEDEADKKKNGPVDAKKCEELLTHSTEKLMSGRQAKMLASIPGFTDRHGETNFRKLPRELLPIDTLQLDRASPLQHALLELIRHAEELETECKEHDDPDRRDGLLSVDEFYSAVKASGMQVPYSVVIPGMVVAAGALQEGKVFYSGVIELAAVAHRSELQWMGTARSGPIQELRRQVLRHKEGILKEIDARAAKDGAKKPESVELLVEVLKDRTQLWKMDAEEAGLMAADVLGERFGLREGRDARRHVEELQFHDFIGTEQLDDAAPALFKSYEHLMQTCMTADEDDTGVLELDAFAEAMRAARIEAKFVDIVTSLLKDEMTFKVQWRELLEHRLVVLGKREAHEILKGWRSVRKQEVRQQVMRHAGTVMLELAEEQQEGTVLLEQMEKALIKVLADDKETKPEDIHEVLQALPVRREDGNLIVEPGELSNFKACNMLREMDETAIKPLLRTRKSVLTDCRSKDRGSSGSIDAERLAQVMYRSQLPASAVDCLVAHADRSDDGRLIEYEAFLARFAVVTKQERHRLELLADDRLQKARALLVAAEEQGTLAGISAAAGQPWMLLKKLKEKIEVDDDEGLALAVHAFADTQKGVSGSLRAEDLVDQLTLSLVDFEPADFRTEEPMTKKGKRPVTGGGENLTPGQKIWRDKILKPRKPGVMDMLAFMRDMPLCVGLSPLREEHKSGHNLPSESVAGLGDFRALTIARETSPSDMQSLMMASVMIKSGEGVPYFNSDKYQILERRARVCLVKLKEERFVGGAHVVPLSRRNAGKDDWIFSKKEETNPFIVRADTTQGLQLYIEFSLLCRKKETTTQGQQALAKGDVKELSCGHGCLVLDKESLPPAGKKTKLVLPLFGGVPWEPRHIEPKDCKKGGLFKRMMGKKIENKLHIELVIENPAKAALLPHNMVCSAVCLEALSQFRAAQKHAASLADPFTRPVQPDLVLTTFPVIMDSFDLMFEFAHKWKERQKALHKWGKKPSADDKNKAFSALVREFYPLIHLDHANLPRNPDAGPNPALQARAKTLDNFRRMKKVTDMLEGNFNDFRYTPFKVDEFVAVV